MVQFHMLELIFSSSGVFCKQHAPWSVGWLWSSLDTHLDYIGLWANINRNCNTFFWPHEQQCNVDHYFQVLSSHRDMGQLQHFCAIVLFTSDFLKNVFTRCLLSEADISRFTPVSPEWEHNSRSCHQVKRINWFLELNTSSALMWCASRENRP